MKEKNRYACARVRKIYENRFAKIAKEGDADVCTNLLSNSSGELVSTYDTFQRQSIRGAIPENRASPAFFSFVSFFFLFCFLYLHRTRVNLKIADRILARADR